MASLNKAMVIGRLGKDPRVNYTASGMPVTNFSVATDESYKDKQTGNKVDKAEWHNVVVWGKSAEFCGNYLGKGRLVLVEGRLQTRKWQDQEGVDRYQTEIVAYNVQALDKAPQGQQHDAPPPMDKKDEDNMGPGFPSEASGMDDMPF